MLAHVTAKSLEQCCHYPTQNGTNTPRVFYVETTWKRLISRLLSYRKEKMRLISLLLTESSEKKFQKSPIRYPSQYWIRPESTDRWWLSYETNSVRGESHIDFSTHCVIMTNVPIQSEWGKTRTRITLNTDIFHAVANKQTATHFHQQLH